MIYNTLVTTKSSSVYHLQLTPVSALISRRRKSNLRIAYSKSIINVFIIIIMCTFEVNLSLHVDSVPCIKRKAIAEACIYIALNNSISWIQNTWFSCPMLNIDITLYTSGAFSSGFFCGAIPIFTNIFVKSLNPILPVPSLSYLSNMV